MKDEEIEKYIKIEKKLSDTNIKWKNQRKSLQSDFNVYNTELGISFTIYLRQNLIDPDHFSCGLVINLNNEKITLLRFNGCNHEHTNHLEKEKFAFKYHIHRATQRYIDSNQKIDGYAYPTERYSNLEGAIKCLLADANITGIKITDLLRQEGFSFD